MNTQMFVEAGIISCLIMVPQKSRCGWQIVYIIETLLAYLKDILVTVTNVTIKQHLDFD